MHLDREVLNEFLLGRLGPHENRQVLRHLLSGCEECRRASREVWNGAEAPADMDLSAIASRAWKQGRAFDKERTAAPELVAELAKLTPEQQLLVAHNSSRLRTRSVCELLSDEAVADCASDAELAIQRATIATLLAARLPRGRYGTGVVNDVQARAWSALGHAQRAASRLFEAEDSFARAEDLLEIGSGDAGQVGRFWYLKAILRHAQRRFEEALELYQRAAREFAADHDGHLVGSTQVDRARTLRELGDLPGAVRSVRAGLARLDPERSPRMALVGKHNLTLYLQELGETEEATRLIAELLPLHARLGGTIDKVRLRWLEGKIAHLQGDLDRGRAAFEEVRQAFIERSMPYDAALVSLDLAAVHLRQERFAEVLELAGEMLTVFRALAIDREAIAAVYLLEQVAAARQVSLTLLAELATYLKRVREEPGLVFEPSGG
ncbi:MAG: tetratricopeptide repeat protein [Thermoanaerobaculia bacterium]